MMVAQLLLVQYHILLMKFYGIWLQVFLTAASERYIDLSNITKVIILLQRWLMPKYNYVCQALPTIIFLRCGSYSSLLTLTVSTIPRFFSHSFDKEVLF